MSKKQKKMPLRILMLIATHKLGDKAEKVFQKEQMPLRYRFNAEGTAPSEVMDMLGLGSIDKCVLVSVIRKDRVSEILKKLKEQLQMTSVNSGIAFTIPLNGVSNMVLHLVNQQEQENSTGKDKMSMAEATHGLITAIVNRGFSGDVMNAARSAGATGGTVIHSRQMSSDEASALWGVAGEEKEIVMILADAENRVAIMQAISEKCGMQSDAKGLVMSMPIDSVTGI